MKMIRAIIRPECEHEVVHALERIGVFALTKFQVTGRGRQGGAEVGSVHYAELAKAMLMVVVDEEKADEVITTIADAAYTGFPGDGRIFISSVEKSIRLRTGDIQTAEAASSVR
ncbi:P-II family nitrogen regulator [Candidatus Sumerlaeota bacterium]|nr:P-II family nitrogen regulator [Candidatus Sumerlaeota bacterium]MBI3735685.1 P-II family nitrogen regulator [Candidatus Sumerlaeota bacterium]